MFENYVGARQLLREATAKTKLDKFVRDYFETAIDVEADWQLECISHVAEAGDLHVVQLLIERARGLFGDSLAKRLKPYEKRLATRAGEQLVAAGRAYAAACAAKDHAAIAAIVKDHAGTVYASAAQQYLADSKDGKAPHPRSWFLGVDRYLARFEYLTTMP